MIKKGRGPDAHHAYQVYIKLGGDEWNVYRRFAEFLEFHRQISVHLPEVGEFNFPPKKAMNDKVEDGHGTCAQICLLAFLVLTLIVFPVSTSGGREAAKTSGLSAVCVGSLFRAISQEETE